MGAAAKKAKAPSADDLGAKIRRLFDLSVEAKRIEKEQDALKAEFRALAKQTDAVFEVDDGVGVIEVVVTPKQREGWDGDMLTAHFGVNAPRWKKTSHYLEVSCRERKQ